MEETPSLSLLEVKTASQDQAESKLAEFIEQAWPVVEPTTPYVHGPHIQGVADHLEAVTRGQIRNLLINLPPRHMKSLTVSVFWPVWEWIANPSRRWLFASYAASLSTHDSLKCRRLIESRWFQERWGNCFQLTSDQNQKMRFDNDKTGCRLATSVGGSATGEGGDRVVVDDPHNVAERESDSIRRATLTWWDETMSTRLNDPKTGAKVIVMQRIHEKDLSGHVLEQGGYVHLCLPAEFEPARRCVTVLPWKDERTIEGELLWPERISRSEIADFKLRLGPAGYAGQFQQRPVPVGGNRFKQEWFRYFRMCGNTDAETGGRGDAEREREGDAETGGRGDAEREREGDAETGGRGDAEREREGDAETGGRGDAETGGRGDAETGGRGDAEREREGDAGMGRHGDAERREDHVGDAFSSIPASPRLRLPASLSYILLRPDGSQLRVAANQCTRFAVMDPAGTEPDQNTRPCYTVIQVWDVTPTHDMLLVHQYRDQVQAPDAAAAAIRIAREFDVSFLAIEKDGLGLGIVQTVKRSGIAVRPIKARGSKEARSETAEIRMAGGTIYFPHGAPFLWDLEQELLHFPRGEYADQVDALAHAAMQVQRMAGFQRTAPAAPEEPVVLDDEPSDVWT